MRIAFWLRFAALVSFLLSWLGVIWLSVWYGWPAVHRRLAAPRLERPADLRAIVGLVWQALALLIVTAGRGNGPLRLHPGSLAAVLLLAPLSTLLLWLCFRQMPPAQESLHAGIVRTGPYAWLRHPLYLAMGGLVLATGLLVATPWAILAGLLVYALGSGLRIAAEETQLQSRWGQEYVDYRQRVRWRLLPLVY